MRIKLDLGNPVVTHQRILLHGNSNAGKTFLAGKSCPHSNCRVTGCAGV